MAQASAVLARHGCTHFLLTLITQPETAYLALLPAWEKQRGKKNHGCFGYHLEGPFLNPEAGYRGAHRAAWMRPASWEFLEKLSNASHQALRLITLAPEIDFPHSLDFLRIAAQKNLRLSAGHSALMGYALDEAVKAGLSAWTHLGNAAPSLAPKFDNVIFHALSSALPYLFLIPDGHHLPPHVFRVLARALGKRLLLTTDAMSGAACPPGDYTLGDQAVCVDVTRRACLAGTEKLAGSTLTPFAGVFRAAEMSGLPWAKCWEAFSTRPARWLGLPHELGVGAAASFCLFDLEPVPQLQKVYRHGELVFQN